MKTELEKMRDEGQIEGMVTALRWVRQVLDGSRKDVPVHAVPVVNAELKEIQERISKLARK